MTQLPTPNAQALAHSALLHQLIASEIEKSGGWIDFAHYMHLALYTPDLGYYSHLGKKFGESGDFVTAPEISALFGQCIAAQAAPILQSTQGQLLELGAGSGKLACDLLTALDAMQCVPSHYYILEVSAGLRETQHQYLQTSLPQHLFNRITWLDSLVHNFSGFMFANEVLDALPVHLVHHQAGQHFARGVQNKQGQFTWANSPHLPAHVLAMASSVDLTDDYMSEFNPAAIGLINSLADCLIEGAMLLIDYGFNQAEYYHPQRRQGTLMCHYQHHAHDNPLIYPGLQDITAHVNFTAIAEAGVAKGLTLEGYTNQAQFLINCGITNILTQTPADDVSKYLPLAAQAQKLLSPAEMGELFKVIGFSKHLAQPLLGFHQGNKAHTL
jgi:SAM-dependent MidA family methyltransferase